MDTSKKNSDFADHLTWRSALSQTIAVSIKNMVLFGYGMTLGFPTLLIPVLSGNAGDKEFTLGEDGLSWIGSIGLICVPFGCFLSGVLTQPLGRRRSMQFINIPFLGSWLLFYFSSEVWHIFAALSIAGLAGGLMEAPVLTYVAEVTQPHLRGILSSTSSMSVIAGSMVQFILGTFLKWRTVAMINSLVPVLSISLLFIIPETPLWLLSKKRYAEAKESLAWLRGWVSVEEIDQEYKDLFNQVQTSRGIGNSGFQSDEDRIKHEMSNGNNIETTTQMRKRTKLETLRLFKKRNFIRPYLLVSYVFFLAHFNGVSPIQTYAVNIFTSLNTPIDKYYATALLGILELCGSILCVSLVHYVGKRVLTFISLTGTTICFLSVGIYSQIFNVTSLMQADGNRTIINSTIDASLMDADDSSNYSWIPLTLIISSAFLCHMGIRVLPWILTGEFFPNEIRAIASGFAATSFYVFGFVCNKTFLKMVSLITLPGTFWFYSLMSFIGLVVLYIVLPETEGKTLQEITDHFAGKSRLGNNVVKRRNLSGINNEAFDGNYNKRSNVESKL